MSRLYHILSTLATLLIYLGACTQPPRASFCVQLSVTMIPIDIGFKTVGWVNTFLLLIVPAFFGSPFYTPISTPAMATVAVSSFRAA